jgi:transcriptional regulator with XRE-family HTH domain
VPRRAGPAVLARRLGARIRELRQEAGITQEKLAAYCDVDKGYLSQVESGKRLPSIPVIALLAAELGTEIADLVGFNMTVPRIQLLDAARRRDASGIRQALKRLRVEPTDSDAG